MTANLSQRPVFPAELSAAMTGSWVAIGTLLAPASHIIFDNQGTVAVAISVDGGTTTWKTFSAGEALVLDLRAAHGIASNFSADQGTIFSGNGASGTFRISYIYARET